MNRVIIAGSRDFDNYKMLCKFMNDFALTHGGDIEIISGTARGADKLGEKFAKENNVSLKLFPAHWEIYGRRAGYIRNKQMAECASQGDSQGFMIAFWDGKSKGTKNMIDLAQKHSLTTYIIHYTEIIDCENLDYKNLNMLS